MRQHHRRIGRQPTPMAGVHAPRAQVQDQIEVIRAARAGGDRRHLRHDPRPIARDQHIRLQRLRPFRNEGFQPDGAAFLAGFQHQFDVVAQLAAAFGDDRFQRRQIHRVLALVVGGAAAVPKIAFLGQRPGIEAGAPLILQPAHRVAVAVSQNGGQGRVLDPLGGQDRAEAGGGVGMDRDGEPQPFEPGLDRIRQIGLHILFVRRVLGGAAYRDQ